MDELERLSADLTEERAKRKGLEDQLLEARSLAASLFDLAVDGVVVADVRGRIESFNPAAERIFGYRASEVLGKNVSMLMPEPDRSRHDGYIADYLRTGQPKIIGLGREVVGLRKDGAVFPMDLAVSEFRLVGRRMFTGIVRDITERKGLEEQLLQSSKLASLGELVGGIAHEINNPTGIIVMRSAGLMQEATGRDLPEDVIDDIEVIQRQSDKIAQITSGLLAFSRQAPFSPNATDVNRMVSNAVGLVDHVLKSRSIVSRLDLDRDLPPAVLDPTRLEQVLLNLFNNAMDAMADGGELVLGTGTAVGKKGEAQVRISVSDTGTGIAEEDLDRIFDPFFTTKEVGKGTGLGLSISYGIVQEHGGRLEVDSQPGEGATFHIVLPVDAGGTEA
jgi:PAS domain S-box-containing protein